jgi:CheY-like chemotaxis protein
LAGKRILVVDDDPSIRFLLRLIFEGAGHQVAEAQNGIAALIWIKDQVVPDLVVTDLMMPLMDGAALIEHLRQDPQTARVKILAVTSNPNAREVAGNADSVLGKPFDRSRLLEVANSLLAQEPSR